MNNPDNIEESIGLLQKQVYKLDWKIASAAQDLEKGIDDHLEWYDTYCYKKVVLLSLIEKLKEIK